MRAQWFAPVYMYPGSRYPDWLSGSAYLMDRDVAATLYQAALNTPLFHIEDVFLTGILASKVFRNIKQYLPFPAKHHFQQVGIPPVDHVGFSSDRRKLDPCLFRQVPVKLV